MIRIHRHKKPGKPAFFWVTVYAKNGEPLMHSETMTQKAGAIKNIKAMAKIFSMPEGPIKVTDCTEKTEKEITI